MRRLFDLLKKETSTRELSTILPQDLIDLSEEASEFVKKCLASELQHICIKRVHTYVFLLRELFKVRTSKSLEGEFGEENADYEMLKLIQSFLETVSDIIIKGPHLNGKVLCKVVRDFEHGRRRLSKNEYITLDFIKASILDALGFVKVVRAPSELFERPQ